MTNAQIKEAKKMIGKFKRIEIAEKVGVSIHSLKRAFKGTSLSSYKYASNPALIERVCSFYEKHGRAKTIKQFPNVNHRSLLEKYRGLNRNPKPRKSRWTDSQLAEAARMAGLVRLENQAKFFRRPNAKAGSVRALWMKRFGIGQARINGMARTYGAFLVTKDCPLTETQLTDSGHIHWMPKRIYLWVDMEKHLRSDVPEFVAEAVSSMADFQRWLFKSKNPKSKIVGIIRERR